MDAMILAAGLGTRLRPYTLKRPKPLFPVLNTPLLKIHLDALHAAGFKRITVNSCHLAEHIEKFLYDYPDIFLQKEKKILGTGGALRTAIERYAEEPFLVINGDIFHTVDLGAVFKWHQQSGADVTMVLHDFQRFNNVEVDAAGSVRGFPEPLAATTEESRPLFAFTGIQVVNPQVFRQEEFGAFVDLISIYRRLVSRGGRIQAYIVSGHYWSDMGTPEDYLHLHRDLLAGDVNPASHPALTGAAKPFLVAGSAEISEGVEFSDWVAIGAECRIKVKAKLKRVVVWDGAEVDSGSELSDCIVT